VSARVRVLVPTTWAGLAVVRRQGLPTGTVGYAVTDALADALGLGGDAAALGEDDLDDLAEVVAAAAADASLLVLADEAAATDPGTPSAPARRAVLALDVAAHPADEPDGHPATVVLTEPAAFADVASVLADDVADEPAVERAVRRLLDTGDAARATALLEERLLGWYDPSETG
jgi:hypothetical protein